MSAALPEHPPADEAGLPRYVLTFTTRRRRHLFRPAPIVHLVLDQISRAAGETRFAVLAYCFMPDQVHLLVQGQTAGADCKRFVARAKQYAAFQYSRAYLEPLWQRHGSERILGNEEATLDAARYILEAPVRAGLAARVEEYPFVGSLACALGDLLA
jgi:REP element-mobilizing transposase RayT